MVKYIRQQQFAAESEHFPNRAEIKSKGGAPWAYYPKIEIQYRDINQTLCCESPIRESAISQGDADYSGDD